MMHDPDRQLQEDRALRDAARALVTAGIANLRADLASKGFGERIVDRMNEGAADIWEEAIELADDNRAGLTAVFAVMLLWFMRNPIIALFTAKGDADGDSGIRKDGQDGRDGQDEVEPA